MKKGVLPKRICKSCGQYFPSYAALKRHKVTHKNQPVEVEAEEQVEAETDSDNEILHPDVTGDDLAPIFDVKAFQQPFSDVF